MRKFKSIGIAGLGLLGGSVALAAKSNGLVSEIFGYTRSPETLKRACNLGIVDRPFTDFSEMVKRAEFVFLAGPISVNLEFAKNILKVKPSLLFTDVGSTKKAITDLVEKLFPNGNFFAGSHPMAGSEKRGIDEARKDLFTGRTVIVTPVKNSDTLAVGTIRNFWESIGAKTVIMSAEKHDEICCYTSHLPHLLAFLLVKMIEKKLSDSDVLACMGPGFRDTTRIAASDQEIWAEIFISNKKNMLLAIKNFKLELKQIEQMIEKNDIESLKKWIEKVRQMRNGI
ncbi:MAG TPA: prephenate dehydrogenase [bacterium]|nr:prephenate dehydrogenase [bacterium]HOL35356.1 prephenate dehydrogenase [bacterium]HPP07712.1 prephenate dehydrogenase [bacterium]